MNVLLGVTGGISVYKTLNLVRRLIKSGHTVRVMMTPHAAKMVSPLLFQTLSRHPVMVEDFDTSAPLAHIEWADWCDVFALVPATANTLAKAAHGIADNLLTSTFLACEKRRVVFPAMNHRMYDHPATQKNMETLRSYGIEVIEPACGDLACGTAGRGRLPEEDVLFAHIARDPKKPLDGSTYVVSAGGTVEKIDPVRFITNASSGRMGLRIAQELFRLGAKVVVVAGKTEVTMPVYLPTVKVESALEMLKALETQLKDADGLFMAAAVADYRVEQPSGQKMKKSGGELTLKLVENPDLLKTLRKEFPDLFMLGFALETGNAEDNALDKLERKGLDFIVLNRLSESFSPLGSEDNELTLYSKSGKQSTLARTGKDNAARWIVQNTLLGPL